MNPKCQVCSDKLTREYKDRPYLEKTSVRKCHKCGLKSCIECVKDSGGTCPNCGAKLNYRIMAEDDTKYTRLPCGRKVILTAKKRIKLLKEYFPKL
jgi:hypothetical protein